MGSNALLPQLEHTPVKGSTSPPHSKQGMDGGSVKSGLSSSNLPHFPHDVQG